MKILIKLGGTLLDDAALRSRLAREIAGFDANIVVVHGGGKQMTRYLFERGVESRFVNGLRVTTPEVLDAVLKIFAGTVNRELVAAFIAAGAFAVGLSGIDGLIAEAEQMSAELGFVGRTIRSNGRLLELLTANGYLPVVACVAVDRNGQIYNVNADQMAVDCATSFQADRLLFLTDVEGVRGADNRTVATLTADQSRELIASGIATGGMQAKLNAALDALERGVGDVVIAPGALPDVIQKFAAGEPVGTRMIAAAEVAS